MDGNASSDHNCSFFSLRLFPMKNNNDLRLIEGILNKRVELAIGIFSSLQIFID